MVKALVLFYSKNGNTKFVAEEISKKIKGDVEEIIDLKDRNGILGYLKAGRDAMLKKTTKIKTPGKKIDDYDVVFIGTPVWGYTLVPAIRTYLENADFTGKKFAVFCTMDGGGHLKTFDGMRALIKNGTFVGQKEFIKPMKDESASDKVSKWIDSLDLTPDSKGSDK